MDTAKVAIVGFGTIGSGAARLLLDSAGRIARHSGRPVRLVRVVDKDLVRPREVALPRGLLTDDLTRVTGDPEIAAVIQLIGGLEPARSIMLELLESGKDVITANKALLAAHGDEVFSAAAQKGVEVGFEASVGGGIPLIRSMKEGLVANRIQGLFGILNGTGNYILTKMTDEGTPFSEVLKEAQEAGEQVAL